MKVTIAMFRTYWDMKVARANENAQAIKAEIAETELQIGKLVNRIVETNNDSVARALENKISELERHKLLLTEKAADSARPPPPFEENLELALRFLASPYKIWSSGVFEIRRLVLRIVFSEHLSYDRFDGYRTPKLSLPFRALGPEIGQFLPELRNGGRDRD
ncbi:hypothetical protein [Novosphingobium beihaiensis]|uniref:Uncharacterized protein n=1 Tax=Novosphingobium beihaiensis TaxID=2930389 RepID=A0ABT0BTA8_9SPHN|nr:hypothetical protein [Novosphingobium beihaiensis]MCJ2187904.1 hypothetical protein [Novosphingobium beihaiensis]